MHDDFTDLDHALSYPAPIAQAIAVMLSEIEESGEETTPDETASVIEAVFIYLGRIWVAEYLHALTTDPTLSDHQINQDLASRLAGGRAPLTGHWVGLARRIRDRLSGHQTVVDDLQAIDSRFIQKA